jgi:hypothetical protein
MGIIALFHVNVGNNPIQNRLALPATIGKIAATSGNWVIIRHIGWEHRRSQWLRDGVRISRKVHCTISNDDTFNHPGGDEANAVVDLLYLKADIPLPAAVVATEKRRLDMSVI